MQKSQKAFASAMNKAFGEMEAKRLKAWMIVFCLTGVSYSSYLVINAIIKPSAQKSFAVDQINRLLHIDKTGDEIERSENLVSETLFQQMQKFKTYMDSLKQRDIKTYDSILFQRPMLMDSVRLLEQMYYSQKQNMQYEK